MSDLSLEFGSYLAVLMLTLLKTPRQVRPLALTMSLRSLPPPNTTIADTRHVSLSTDRGLLAPSPVSFPPGSQVSGVLLPSGPGIQAEGREG